jgi:alkanesulfonate monooxygenase SsuD/methylene tetrahydromethanopterin reductase-like flavin-dependent oxidoreductase (luciferase family)
MIENFGLFMQPSHPPERSLADGQKWDLDVIEWADKLGYSEVWIGEHYTLQWEPNPAPDLLIAQALMRTKQIRLGAGGHLLPYHHPVELAHRVAYMDHLAEGRLNFGIAASGVPTDLAMFNVDGKSGENRKMTAEALEIILKLWNETEPFEFRGEYWDVNSPKHVGYMGPHIRPLQHPHPPIGVTGISPGSETLKMAGEHGFLPLSFGGNLDYIASHWDSVLEGAKRTGRTPNRQDWRITRDIFVADSHEEALEHTLHGMLGRKHDEYYLDIVRRAKFLEAFKHSPSVRDEDVTKEYLAEHGWFIGTPDMVAKRIHELHEGVGGFGTLLMIVADYADDREAWMRSMQLMMEEVLPRVKRLQKNS